MSVTYSKSPTQSRGRPGPLSTVGTVAPYITGGTTALPGLRAIEYGGDGVTRQTVLVCTAMPVTVANTTGASFGNQKLYDFPLGRIFVKGCTAYFGTITFGSTIGSAGSGDYSIGTTATADATLSGTDVNILPSSAMLDPFVVRTGSSNAGTALAAAAAFDGTATAIDAILNVTVDDADVSDAGTDTAYFTGVIVITWENHGVYQTTETTY